MDNSVDSLRRLVREAFVWIEVIQRRTLATSHPPLTVPQMDALDVLERHADLRLGELAAVLLTVKSNASGIVDRLSALGLVERRPDAADRRLTRVHLTSDGRNALLRGRAAINEALASAISEGKGIDAASVTSTLQDLVKQMQTAATHGEA